MSNFYFKDKKPSIKGCFLLDFCFCAAHYKSGVNFGSSSCCVTGVSSLTLARRPKGLAGFFLF
ncbi:hypothetical protein, partial [Acidocella sp.]|uniref:hypothetical protein n=1 Tax=Acidocella sp. TaxID=50710 RepID=UPI002634EF6A